MVIDNIIIQSNTVVDDSIQRIVLFEEIKIRSQNFKILRFTIEEECAQSINDLCSYKNFVSLLVG